MKRTRRQHPEIITKGTKSTLPLLEDMLMEVLSRVPLTSIGRLRCVRQQWRSVTSTSYFADAHLARSEENNNKVCSLIMESSNNLECSTLGLWEEGGMSLQSSSRPVDACSCRILAMACSSWLPFTAIQKQQSRS